MNIIQIHEKVRFFIDHVNSPRYSLSHYDQAIRTAINDILEDRYDNIKNAKKEYWFQAVQRIRDELYTLVNVSGDIAASGAYLPIASYPSGYRYLLNSYATISSTEYTTTPLSYDEEGVIDRNPYKRPQLTYPIRVYHIESALGLKIVWGSSVTLQTVKISYIKDPAEVSSGTEYRYDDGVFPGSYTVIAVETTKVTGGSIYQPGESFAMTGASTLDYGSVVYNYTNTDLPSKLHEEIAKRASSILPKIVENYNKGMMMDKEVNVS